MLTRDVVVVGAGVAGLAMADELGCGHAVTVIDRLPAVGGVLGYDHPLVEQLNEVVRRRHVDILLGTTALRWRDNQLLVAGPSGIEWISARCLAFCGGTRPSTAAELGIGGDRVAGIHSATVAIHLMEARVQLGMRVVIIGASDWAVRAARHLERQGTAIVSVVSKGEQPAFGEERWEGWRPLEIHGTARVSELLIGKDGSRQRIPCDGVILGAHLKPLRNIDGAVFGGHDVVYVQDQREVTTATEVEASAREAAAKMLAGIGGAR